MSFLPAFSVSSCHFNTINQILLLSLFSFNRLGFLIDILSHAAVVGFMAGAAIVIGLQQLKGLLGIPHFTNKTDAISVVKAVWNSLHHTWSPQNFILGCSFLCFILTTRYLVIKPNYSFCFPFSEVEITSELFFFQYAC